MRIPHVLCLAGLLMAGCTTAPDPIRHAPPADLWPAEVRLDPDRYRGSEVRWGGQIVAVHNHKDETVIEIVARRLDRRGRPLLEDHSAGRFLATVQGFLDPAIYARDREITVRGTLAASAERNIGEFRYRYPVVHVDTQHLWPPRPPPEPAYYHDPFWPSPGYPWGWPYYHPRIR